MTMDTVSAGATPVLASRLDFLSKAQNPDGGWGYFPGKQSWLEPTAWATLALHGRPEADRAWNRMLSWQGADGSWRPGQDVQVDSWATALCVTISHSRGEFGEPFKRGLHWLLKTGDAEATTVNRTLNRLGLYNVGRNPNYKAWPWKPGDSYWIEPTVHSLVALKLVRKRLNLPEIHERIALGEAAILDQRCTDGGWNYGNHVVQKVPLSSYPETTALALIGLQQVDANKLSISMNLAEKFVSLRQGRMASAWLTIALEIHGRKRTTTPYPDLVANGDVLLSAVEAIAASDGLCGLLQTGEHA